MKIFKNIEEARLQLTLECNCCLSASLLMMPIAHSSRVRVNFPLCSSIKSYILDIINLASFVTHS